MHSAKFPADTGTARVAVTIAIYGSWGATVAPQELYMAIVTDLHPTSRTWQWSPILGCTQYTSILNYLCLSSID